jgi:hypothetical protein
VICVLLLALSTACRGGTGGDEERPEIERQVALSATVGERYIPNASGKLKLAKGNARFVQCGEGGTPVQDDGTLHVIPTTAGPLALCVEARGPRGERDRFEWSVQVGYRPGESPEELRVELDGFTKKLQALMPTIASTAPTLRRCSPDAIARLDPKAAPLFLDVFTVTRIFGSAAETEIFSSWRAEIVSPLLQRQNPFPSYVRQLSQTKHVLILAKSSFRAPLVHSRDQFTGGQFAGGLYLFDLEKAELLCTAPVTFESSTVIDTVFGEGQRDVDRDFVLKGEAAVQAAARQMHPDLSAIPRRR